MSNCETAASIALAAAPVTRACPYTSGWWSFVHCHGDVLARNRRLVRTAVRGLARLGDVEAVLQAERERGEGPP